MHLEKPEGSIKIPMEKKALPAGFQAGSYAID
jgi:hypothetical protein